MDLREKLFRAVDRYTKRHNITRSTLSNYALNDGKFFDRIEKGGNFTTSTYEALVAFMKKPPRSQGART